MEDHTMRIAMLFVLVGSIGGAAVLTQRLDVHSAAALAGDCEATGSGEEVVLTGSGAEVTDTFELKKGRYKVTAEVEVGGAAFDAFSVSVYGEDDRPDLLFNEMIQVSGSWDSSQVFVAEQTGDYFVETSITTSPWTLTFERI
jgi:hypothetical protein